MDFNALAGAFGVPVAAMVAMGSFLYAMWRYASGPLMEKVMLPLVQRHISFLDNLENRSQEHHAQIMESLQRIAVKLGVVEQDTNHA